MLFLIWLLHLRLIEMLSHGGMLCLFGVHGCNSEERDIFIEDHAELFLLQCVLGSLSLTQRLKKQSVSQRYVSARIFLCV